MQFMGNSGLMRQETLADQGMGFFTQDVMSSRRVKTITIEFYPNRAKCLKAVTNGQSL